MASPFASAAARISAAIDRSFGEAARLLPRRAAERFTAAGVDPGRPARELSGVTFHLPPGLTKPDSGMPGVKSFMSDLKVSSMRATVALDQFPGEAEWPRVGDRLDRIDPSARFEITRIDADDSLRLTLYLVRIVSP